MTGNQTLDEIAMVRVFCSPFIAVASTQNCLLLKFHGIYLAIVLSIFWGNLASFGTTVRTYVKFSRETISHE